MFLSRGDWDLGVAFQTHPGVRRRLEGGKAAGGNRGIVPGKRFLERAAGRITAIKRAAVDESTSRRGTDTRVHRPEKPAGPTDISTSGLSPLRGLQETRVATREESGDTKWAPRGARRNSKGEQSPLLPLETRPDSRVSLECNPKIPVAP